MELNKVISKYSITELILGVVATALGLLVFLTVIGNIFPATVQAVGLDWLYVPLKGVYADCSKAENRGVGFCKPKEDWHNHDDSFSHARGIPNRSKGSALPFNLYGE